jgi:hypothetical protein
MDQTCPVVHKSRRPQVRLKTVALFYIHCVVYYAHQTYKKALVFLGRNCKIRALHAFNAFFGLR